MTRPTTARTSASARSLEMTGVTTMEVSPFRQCRTTRSTPRLFPAVRFATRSYRARMRLDHVVIAVSDFERSNAFYRDVLGAEVVEVDGRVAYRIGGQQLNVHGPGVRPAGERAADRAGSHT